MIVSFITQIARQIGVHLEFLNGVDILFNARYRFLDPHNTLFDTNTILVLVILRRLFGNLKLCMWIELCTGI